MARAGLSYLDDCSAGLVGSVSPDVWVYQLTDDGLALDFAAKGTKHYRDDDLNSSCAARLTGVRNRWEAHHSSATTRGSTPASPGAADASASSPIPAAHLS
jgi:hypothetical protein